MDVGFIVSDYYAILASLVFVYMNIWFVVSSILKRNDVADIAWGLGFVILAWTSLFVSTDVGFVGLVVSIMVTIWGLRLSIHIYSRNRRKTEDNRYKNWRESWGKWFVLRSYFQVYILQGLLMYLISLPVIFINLNAGKYSDFYLLSLVGIVIWLIGFYFETRADAELRRFIANPLNKGKLLTSGLWNYSRHPNYFGEVVQWWGVFIVAVFIEGGFLTIIGPATITFLILKVSGIPLLEKAMSNNPDYTEYKKRTNSFFPWFPKNLPGT